MIYPIGSWARVHAMISNSPPRDAGRRDNGPLPACDGLVASMVTGVIIAERYSDIALQR
jgi:hypothetical protein